MKRTDSDSTVMIVVKSQRMRNIKTRAENVRSNPGGGGKFDFIAERLKCGGRGRSSLEEEKGSCGEF